jgi:hypothetical protein
MREEVIMPERWDCIFVDRIGPKGRIYLTQASKYGHMYVAENHTPAEEPKVRKSIPRDCGPIKGMSNESKILCATAIATALNRNDIRSSKGIVIRGFKGKTPFPGLQTALAKIEGKTLREEGTTGWLVYVSSNEEFCHIADERFIGEELSAERTAKITECIRHIEAEWLKATADKRS